MPTFKAENLIEFSKCIFKVLGTPAHIADYVSRSLVGANLAGIDSHGLALIKRYVREIDTRQIIPDAEPKVITNRGCIEVIDGQRGFGQITAAFGIERAIKKARANGVGVVGLRNTNHIGRVGEYVLKAAEKDLLAIAFVMPG